jgi:hypothetical protein
LAARIANKKAEPELRSGHGKMKSILFAEYGLTMQSCWVIFLFAAHCIALTGTSEIFAFLKLFWV